jgi:hypothetical protein
LLRAILDGWRGIFFCGQRFFTRIEIGLPLFEFFLLLGLMFGSETLLDLAFNFRILFRFGLLFLTGNQRDGDYYRWNKKLFHGDD